MTELELLLKFDIENKVLNHNPGALIIGSDEVGRGCIAGPIVGGSVIWDSQFIQSNIDKLKFFFEKENIKEDIDRKNLLKILSKKIKEDESFYDLFMLMQIDDSKKLGIKKRELLKNYIIEKARAYSIHEISAETIDQNGIGETNKKVLENSALKIIQSLNINENIALLVDHFEVFSDKPQYTKISITKGDQKSLSIAAASIIAKTHRDNLMQTYHNQYPQYSFNSNVGYGTAAHILSIKEYGLTPLHRKSFTLNLI